MKSIITRIFSIIILSTIFFASSIDVSAKEFVIVIDPGHGGKDHGAVDNGVKEKDINLQVALKLGDYIKKNLKNTKVIYTRQNDSFVSLQGRAEKANKAKGDLFISIHTNSVDAKARNRSSVAGSSVYVLGSSADGKNKEVVMRENLVIELEKDKKSYQGFDPSSDQSYIMFEMAQKQDLSHSIAFAKLALEELVNTAKRKDKGVNQAGFWVLWATSMPAVLVELDFICNPTSAQYLSSPAGQDQLAKSLFNAVKKYYKISGGGKGKLSADFPLTLDNDSYSESETVLATRTAKSERIHRSNNENRGRTSTYRRRRNTSAAKASEEAIETVDEIPISNNERNYAEVREEVSNPVSTPEPINSKVVNNKQIKKNKDNKSNRTKSNSNSHARIDKSTLYDNTNISNTGKKATASSKKENKSQTNNANKGNNIVATTTVSPKASGNGSTPKSNKKVENTSSKISTQNTTSKKQNNSVATNSSTKKSTERRKARIDHGENEVAETLDNRHKEVNAKRSNETKIQNKTSEQPTASESKKTRLEKDGKIIYMVKLFSSPSKIKNTDMRLQGLNLASVTVTRHDGKYLYLYGQSEEESAMEALRDKLLDTYHDAEVISIKSN